MISAAGATVRLPFGSPVGLARTGGSDFRKTITAGQRALRRIRVRVTGCLLCAGLLLGAVYELAVSERARRYIAEPCECSLFTHASMLLVEVTFFGRLLSWSLAPLADDALSTRLILALDSVLWLGGATQIVASFRSMSMDHPTLMLLRAFSYYNLLVAFLFVCGAVWAGLADAPPDIQGRMWRMIGGVLAMYLPVRVALAVGVSASCGDVSDEWWGLVVGGAALHFALFRRDLREGVQAYIGGLFDAKCSRAAAGVAGLVGNLSAKEALAEASRRFRCVTLKDLSYEDLADNKPNPSLFSRSRPCRLYECDAFLSHSWHDNPRAKWASLHRWRDQFVATHGREPTLWIDKCCLDQQQIEVDLRCLPIFLSGCSSLVVFCGPTSLTRLWCILELFTFVHMKRSVDRIEFVQVTSCNADVGEREVEALVGGFARFHAGRCLCSCPDDKRRILGIIRAAFGSLTEFNHAVRDIFEEVGFSSETLPCGSESDDSQCTCSPASSTVGVCSC